MTSPDMYPGTTLEWETRLQELWASLENLQPEDFIARIDAMVAELPPGNAIGLFEQACARDSTGHSDLAAPLYGAALDKGLTGLRRRRAVIQMSSSIRNLGHAELSVALLTKELEQPSDELDEAVRAFLALALADLGREREALSMSLISLSRYLPRYNRSLARYAKGLLERHSAQGA